MTKKEAIEFLGIEIHCADKGDERDLRKAMDMGIEALKRESCGDYISRQAVLDLCDMQGWFKIPYEYTDGNKHIKGYDEGRIINITKLEKLPPVQPIRLKGRWTNGNPNCPCCGEDKFKDLDADIWSDWQPKYCPNCGAKMESEGIDEDSN